MPGKDKKEREAQDDKISVKVSPPSRQSRRIFRRRSGCAQCKPFTYIDFLAYMSVGPAIEVHRVSLPVQRGLPICSDRASNAVRLVRIYDQATRALIDRRLLYKIYSSSADKTDRPRRLLAREAFCTPLQGSRQSCTLEARCESSGKRPSQCPC